jgi:hypothetical protein
MVVEVPPESLGIFDDMWFRWILDFGAAGPDRGQGGKNLILPPGYGGLLPEGGYFVARSRTDSVGLIARAFLENNDPAPAGPRAEALSYPASSVMTGRCAFCMHLCIRSS